MLQIAFAGTTETEWRASTRGLTPRDLAMHVVMPEVDGRIFAGAVAFKAFAEGAIGTAALSRLSHADRRGRRSRRRLGTLATHACGARHVALVLANYPNRDGRLGNGVGLDTPASVATPPRRDARGRL